MSPSALPIPKLGQATRVTLSYLGQDGHALAELALKLKRATPTQTLVIISANGFDAQRLL